MINKISDDLPNGIIVAHLENLSVDSNYTVYMKNKQSEIQIISNWGELDWDFRIGMKLDRIKAFFARERAKNLGIKAVVPDGCITIDINTIKNHSQITSVIIPEGVKTIGDEAFKDCNRLESVVIPPGVTRIGRFAFWGCTKLETITVPDSVVDIGAYAFATTPWLKSQPEGVICAGSVLIAYKGDEANIEIPSGVKTIGPDAFCWNDEVERITIPDTVTKIGTQAFAFCHNLKSIVFPDTIEEIGIWALQETTWLKRQPQGITRVGKVLLGFKGGAKKIVIPEGIITIGPMAFLQKKIKSIQIPYGVKTIDEQAFCECESLENIDLPKSVKIIEEDAFYGCRSLKRITIPSDVVFPEESVLKRQVFGKCDSVAFLKILCSESGVEEELSGSYKFPLPTIVSKKIFTTRSCILGMVNSEGCDYFAYSVKGGSDTLSDYIWKGRWEDYDAEVLNNGPTFKFKLPARLAGAIGRLRKPKNLKDENRKKYIELLEKNISKVILLSENLGDTSIIKALFDQGVVNSKNEKKVRKLLEASEHWKGF